MLTVTEVWQAGSTVNSHDKIRRCRIWISSRTLTTPQVFFMVFWTPRAKYQNNTPNHDMAASFQILSDKLFINYSTIEFYVILVNDIIIKWTTINKHGYGQWRGVKHATLLIKVILCFVSVFWLLVKPSSDYGKRKKKGGGGGREGGENLRTLMWYY